MFGRLTLDAFYHDALQMGAVYGTIGGGIALVAILTYFKRWTWLWKEWLTTVDHKKIGIMYTIMGLVMLIRGFADGMFMRSQQAVAFGANHGFLSPDHFAQFFTAHGTIMLLMVAMPLLVGLMNLVVPLQIGARDVAFPLLNSISLWLTFTGISLVMVSLGIGDFSISAWTGLAPLFEKTYTPNSGVDYWMWSVQLGGIGSTLTGINFIVTILKMRAPGMTLMRMPLFTWTALTTSVLVVLSFPVLTGGLFLLTMDRYLGMHFFTNDLGGNMMLWTNVFWMWGHPEVYILILPAFGVFSEVVATFSRKALFGYKSLVYATAVIMFLSFTVWLHHFFTMGNHPNVNVFFGITTMLIAIPTGVKVFDWLMTMYKGQLTLSVPMYWTIGFFVLFVVGGMTGVLMAIPPADFVVHNSLFLVAHFHNVLIPGAIFGYFAGINYWFPKAFGFKLNEKWGRLSFWGWTVGFILAFGPVYVLGFMGMPRRLSHYDNPHWQIWLIIAWIGMALIAFGVFAMLVQFLLSIINRKNLLDETGDPWNGRTLEWMTSSPPPEYNFAVIPDVNGLDAFWQLKEKNQAHPKVEKYSDIAMPKSRSEGFIIGLLTTTFGFAMIWYMWWLAIVSLLGIVACIIKIGFTDDIEFVIPAKEVEETEKEYLEKLIKGTA